MPPLNRAESEVFGIICDFFGQLAAFEATESLSDLETPVPLSEQRVFFGDFSKFFDNIRPFF